MVAQIQYFAAMFKMLSFLPAHTFWFLNQARWWDLIVHWILFVNRFIVSIYFGLLIPQSPPTGLAVKLNCLLACVCACVHVRVCVCARYVRLSICRTIDMSDYRYVGLSICRTIDRDPACVLQSVYYIKINIYMSLCSMLLESQN